MSDNGNNGLALLEAHRANLAASKTFEEYRDHHVAYVDCLIERVKADIAKHNATTALVYRVATTEQAEPTEPPKGETP